MFCLYTLCSVQAKIQMLTTYCRILTRFHQALFLNPKDFNINEISVSFKENKLKIYVYNNNQHFSHSTVCCWIMKFTFWSILFMKNYNNSRILQKREFYCRNALDRPALKALKWNFM